MRSRELKAKIQSLMAEKEKITNPWLNARYEIIKKIGEGHTSAVYLARDHKRKLDVAVKIIEGPYF